MNAEKLFSRDNKQRRSCGWGSMAWIPPKIPIARSKAEVASREVFAEMGYDVETSYMLHIYSVLELIERGVKRGIEIEKARSIHVRP